MRSTNLAAFLAPSCNRCALSWGGGRLVRGSLTRGEIKIPRQRGCLARVSRRSVLARQVDYPVGEIQRDFIQRKIGVLNLFGEHDIAVAIVARERSGSVGTYGEFPDLKFLGGNSLVVGLNDRDLVQKPICSTVLGNVLCAVSVENVAVDPVPIPVFAAGELREVAIAESLRRHVVPLSFEVTPTAGARETTGTAAFRARRHRQTWNK